MDDGRIRSIQTAESIFSYAYLVSPRPESDFKAGTFGTDLIIRDDETIAAIKEYINQVMKEAKEDAWDGKVPKNLSLPVRMGDDEIPLEAGALVLKTSTKIQPKVFIRDKDTGKAREVTEEEIEDGEIYSGMLGEVIFSLRAYNYNGVKGITAYINAACKTGIGTPLGIKYNFEEEFSEELDDDDDESEEEAFSIPKSKSSTAKPATTKKVTTKSTKKQAIVEEEDEEDEEDDEDEEVVVVTKKSNKATTKVRDSENITIDDLLKL